MLSAQDPYPPVSSQKPAPDDAEIDGSAPQICVDYLSHEWKDEDVWSSWKAMTKRKYEIANGVRLENASWRTWAKQRGNLKTVSPETLNWLKESDVTWLYGPLHREASAFPPTKVSSMEDRLGIDTGKKSILKHRTLTEILQAPFQISPPNGRLGVDEEEDDIVDVPDTSATIKRRPKNITMNLGIPSSSRGVGTFKKDRHISFNNTVEQCIAVDEIPAEEYYDDTSDYDDESSDEDEHDDMAMSVASIASAHSKPGSDGAKRAIIAKLEPTQLKMGHEYSPDWDRGRPISSFIDSDDEQFGEVDSRYSVADTIPVTHDFSFDQDDGYDYDSDDDYEAHHSSTQIPHKLQDNSEDPLVVDVQNLPGLAVHDTASLRGSQGVRRASFLSAQGGPTPSNTPTIPLSGDREKRIVHMSRGRPSSRTSGALVAPAPSLPQVPLAEDYVEESEGGLIGTAVELLNTARDLLGAIMGSPRNPGQSWYE
ncbi:hypothetical protein Malapachy_3406 [Malassezia pachydermatis]|uniref:Nitrogen regulatory protein areA GATA-like domain-containing protein n=1 Tax=Malassezia pachydermatis TaxID=77020 RepID=A0A0M9VR20_9BASI|nr:hypothetical protein Malapachy_3406 [Malassezia pachydermatis]KOS16165.1 hypothetical protein Malapachy_3406 [Malassezia pachydermatis]